MAFIEVKLRPTSPWRAGHRAGDRERVDVIYHSDALYSAISHAMSALGWLEAWLDATARSAEPAVRFSSLFPFIGKTRLIAPPKTMGTMKLVPLEIARGAAIDPARWQPDVPSESLLPTGTPSPFKVSVRSAAAVDRLTGATEPHRIACLEFASNAGWWGVFEVTPEWEPKVKSAFRLLADSGFGGERSRGWGRSAEPLFSTASALFPDRTPNGSWWLISLFSPNETDQIDWTKSDQTVTIRGGWTATAAKRQLRMIEEGSVLSATALKGRSVDVAPEGSPHPAYRNGQALAIPLSSTKNPPEPEPHLPDPEPDQPEPETETRDTRISGASLEVAEPQPELPPEPEPSPEIPGPEPDPEPMEMRDTRFSSASIEAPEPHLPPPDPEPQPELPPEPEPSPEIPGPEPDPEPMEMRDTRISGASVKDPEAPE